MRRTFSFPRLSFIAAAALLSLAGCDTADTPPSVAAFPPSAQQKIVSAANWQMIAADMWGEIGQRMQASGLGAPSIGLEPPAQKSQFTEAMDNFLYSDIINSGIGVGPDSPFTLTYTVQIVGYTPGRAGPAAPGLYASAAGDNFVGETGPSDSNTEVILTFSLTDSSAVRLRESKIYYIEDDDAGLYLTNGSDNIADSSSVVTSNWYADNPHDADHIAVADANQFSVMLDQHNGPVYNINGATVVASAHCQSVGKSSARFLSQGYPTNDRSVMKATFQCQ